jgi:polar amino acid transport system permease protein
MLLTATNFLFEGKNFLRVLSGLGITLQIAVISILLSGILGIVFGIIMTSKNIIVKVICRTYLEAMRIIPILVWLFIFFFGIPKATGLHIDAKIISIFVFTLWGMAEMGDIVRGAITSMPKHQTESGLALGLKKIQVYRYIVVPQAVRRMIPAAINLATRMIKTTSLVVLIGVVEVLKVGQQIIEVSGKSDSLAPLWVYGFIFFLYFIICYPISILSKKLEAKWQA